MNLTGGIKDMKRLIFAVMLVCVMSAGAFAASEVDVRVARLEGENKVLSAHIEGLEKRIEILEKRIYSESIMSGVMKYFPLILLGTIIIMTFAIKFLEVRMAYSTPEVTLEDARRIINEAISENNANSQHKA